MLSVVFGRPLPTLSEPHKLLSSQTFHCGTDCVVRLPEFLGFWYAKAVICVAVSLPALHELDTYFRNSVILPDVRIFLLEQPVVI
jgi:hypothetical protein